MIVKTRPLVILKFMPRIDVPIDEVIKLITGYTINIPIKNATIAATNSLDLNLENRNTSLTRSHLLSMTYKNNKTIQLLAA